MCVYLCVISEVSQEDQQKIDQFMQNQQMRGLRGRRRMPFRPPGQFRGPLRVIRPSPMLRPAGVRSWPRLPFDLMRMAARAPLGFDSILFRAGQFRSRGFGSGVRGNMMVSGGMPPRRKILVNPHFRGSSSMTVVRSPAPAILPASTYPKPIRDEVPRQPVQQRPQHTVSFTNLT